MNTKQRPTNRTVTQSTMAARRRTRRNRTYNLVLPFEGALARAGVQALPWSFSRVLAAGLLLISLAVLTWFFVDTQFYVYEATVSGVDRLSAEQVFRASGANEHSIFFLDGGSLTQNILAALPGVREAQVAIRMPNLLTLRIVEAEARFVWRSQVGSWLLDADGNVLRADDGSEPTALTVVDLSARSLNLGDRVPESPLLTATALHRLLPEIRTFQYADAEGVSLADARGWKILIGNAEQLEHKVATMQAIVRQVALENRPVNLIDVRYTGSPYYE